MQRQDVLTSYCLLGYRSLAQLTLSIVEVEDPISIVCLQPKTRLVVIGLRSISEEETICIEVSVKSFQKI